MVQPESQVVDVDAQQVADRVWRIGQQSLWDGWRITPRRTQSRVEESERESCNAMMKANSAHDEEKSRD